MVKETVSQAKSRSTKLFGILGALGLVVLGLSAIYVTLLLSDRLRTYHNTTDVADLDGDGDLDALIAGKRQATIWWNDGQGSFSRSNQRFRYSDRHALAVGDFNGDGYPDIFAGAYSAAHSVWFNQGDGTFR